MSSLRGLDHLIFVTARTCSRCGRSFGAAGREHTCRICRTPQTKERPAASTTELSFRERQILVLVQEAKANKEIASELCLTPGTVKEYLHTIFRKTGVRNRTELALWGFRNMELPEPCSGNLSA
jgi:DNA-binding NarL/FixJ family response regulator